MTMNDIAAYAAAFAPDPNASQHFHLGVLVATATDGTATVHINGSALPVSNVRCLQGVHVTTGSVVAMLKNGPDYIIIDALAMGTPGPRWYQQGASVTTILGSGTFTHVMIIPPQPTASIVNLRANVRVDKASAAHEWRGTFYQGPFGSEVAFPGLDMDAVSAWWLCQTEAYDYLPANTERRYLHHLANVSGGGNGTAYMDAFVNRVDIILHPGANVATSI